VCIWDEFKITIDAALQTKINSKEIRWSSFYFLTQAIVDIIILSPDQKDMIKKVQKSDMISKLLELLLGATPNIF
jgi:hydroxymethylpyrimidine/phosphomethylpyrimidine kinase